MSDKLKVIVFALLLLPFFADAQSFYASRRNRDLMVNVGTGAAFYKGDLADPGQLNKAKSNIVIGAEYFIIPRVSARLGFTWFQISGDDSKANDDRVERNLHFRTTGKELSFTGAVNLIPIGTRFYQRPRLNLHAFAGVGLLHFNPRAEYDGKWVALRPLETENVTYGRFQTVFPFGLGARFKIDPFFNILIEGGYRLTFTDYLDDVSSKRYVHRDELKSDMSRALADRRAEYYLRTTGEIPNFVSDPERATQVGRRGNPEDDDGYFIGNITIQYYLPSTLGNNQRKLYNKKRRAIYRRKP